MLCFHKVKYTILPRSHPGETSHLCGMIFLIQAAPKMNLLNTVKRTAIAELDPGAPYLFINYVSVTLIDKANGSHSKKAIVAINTLLYGYKLFQFIILHYDQIVSILDCGIWKKILLTLLFIYLLLLLLINLCRGAVRTPATSEIENVEAIFNGL